MKTQAEQKEHIFAQKLTSGAVIDEDVLLESFRRNEDHSLKILIGLYRGQYLKLFLSVLMFAIKHTPVWALPIVTANIINAATGSVKNAAGTILLNASVMIVLVLQNLLTNYLHTYFYAKVVRNVECGLRSSMIRKLQQLSITYHNEMQSGRLQSKIMRDVEQIENLSSQIFISVLSIILNVIVSLTVVLHSSFTVFLFFAASIPVAVLIRNAFKKTINTRNRNFRREMEETSVKVMEMVELIPVTRAHALEETETKKLDSQLKNVAEHGFKLDMIQSFFGSVSWASFQIFQVICLAFTGWLAVQGKILPGDVVMYQTYFGTIVNQVSGVVTLIPIISKGLESVNSVGDILMSADIEDTGNKKKIKQVAGNITFQNVNFRFKDAEFPVINDLCLSIKKGETVAFVGASGAGKTTLMNLVIGFLRPNSGQILIDGKNLNDIDLQSYRRHISVVPQTPILFTGTIRENITYGSEHISDDFLNKMIDAANLRDLIDSLPDGLDTKITEHGANLSGGQRQRVSIARAFVRDPKILILDEATSALDTVSEKKIQDSIEKLVKDRTTLIVAHRLSTIRNADKIAVIGDGGMLEFGTYDELMEKQGEFYHLRSLQF
ncbi:MAG: ABC transporter ATP-binding protein/permease [Bacteroidales bacterium]|nr:ABC transporter ATP-binding protein/permease [Bacteroidales bacterium]MCM1417003.1 ABC transporter ATP-binding protein/permease [bacterium]MCM1424483.1 ABC transporter ATP-binding protein/permease [bacterium]